MNPYTIFPDCEIQGGGKVADTFLAMGIHRFLEACRHVHGLPYGYNSDRDDPMILFKERMGSCTTKHATIATLAQELSLPIARGVGDLPHDRGASSREPAGSRPPTACPTCP